MADLDSLYRALEKADAAGDTESAKQLSSYIRSVTGYVTPPPPPPSKERTMGEAAKDIGASLVSGIGSLGQLPGQLYGLATGDFSETGLYGAAKKLEKYGTEMKSPGLQAREAARAQKVKEAEEKGQIQAFKTSFLETVKDPALASSFLSEQLPQILPMILTGGTTAAITAGRASAAALAKGATKEAAADVGRAAAAKAGTTAAIQTGAVQQGADVGAGAYDEIFKELVAKGVPEDRAAAETINKARAAGVTGYALSVLANRLLPGASAMERVLAGGRLPGGRIGTAVGTAFKEIPGENIEEVGGRVAQNIAARAAGLERDIMAGTGETAAMATLGAAGLGGTAGLLGRREEAPPAPTPAPPAAPELKAAIQEPTQEERMAAAAERARNMPGFTGAPGADQAMLAARREADAAALAAEERAARIEDERLRKERQARIAEINNTTFSADPVQNEITKARLLAELEPAPAPAEEAPEPEVTPPGEQGLEGRALEGFAGPAQINQRLIAERRAADEAAAKANEDMRKEMIQRINKTTFSADPVANEIAKRRALDELGATEKAKPAEKPAVTEAKEPPGLMTPIEKEQVKPRGEKFYPTSVDEQEELKTLKSQLAEIKRASRPQESGTLYQALKGKLLARPGAVGPQDIAGDDKKVKSLFSKTGTVKTTIAGRPVSVQARTLEDMVADGELDEFLPPNKRVNLGTEANPDFNATESVGIILDMLRDEGGSTTPRFDESVRLRPLKEQRFEIEDRIAELEKLQEGRAKLAGVEPQTEFEDLSMDDLQAMAQQMGIDTEALAESVAFRNQGATEEQYQGELRKELISNINSERGGETETLAQQEGQVGNSPTEEGRAIQKQLEGKSVEQVSQWLIQNAKNPFQKLAARKVQALFRKLEKEGVKFSFKIESGNSRPRKMFAASGSASFTWAPDFTTVDITLNGEPVMENQFGYPSGMSYRTVMHEMLHAVTRTSTKYLPANDPTIVELRTLFNQVVDQYNKDAKAGKLPPVMQMYYKRMNNALANPDELISWGMTDEGMQDYLANINVGPKQTAYNKLVDLIRQVLGLAKPYESALEKLVRTTDSLLEVDVTYLKGSVEQHGYRFGAEKVAPKPISTGAQERLFARRQGYFFNAEDSPLYQKRTAAQARVVSDQDYQSAVRGTKTGQRIMDKNVQIKDGDYVGVRLDLNIRRSTGIPVQAVHQGKESTHEKGAGFYNGDVIKYLPWVTLKNVRFKIGQTAREKIASGQENKSPMGSADGQYVDTDKPNFDGVELRFNPNREHLFRDAMGRAVKYADEITSTGNSVFARGRIEYFAEEDVPPVAVSPSEARLMAEGEEQAPMPGEKAPAQKLSQPIQDELFSQQGLEPTGDLFSSKQKSAETIPEGLEQSGFERLPRTSPRRYKQGANSYGTWERDGVRVSLSSNILGVERGNPMKYMADDGEMTVEALIVDPDKRGSGLASAAMKEVVDLADSQGRTLYLEPVQLEEGSGMTKEQLTKFYSRFGFKSDPSGVIMVREPSKGAPAAPVQEQLFMQSGEDVLKIFGAKKEKAPTPTEKGRAALELLSGMGRDVNDVDDTYRAKVQQAWNNAKDNPKATFDQARSGFARFMDKVQTMAFSSDAALNNRIREAVGDMMLGQEEKIGLLLNTSLSQTVHSDAIANLFMQKGNVRYNTELHKWEGVDSDANFITLSRKLDDIAAQYGLTKQEVELVAHTAFEAKRAKSLVKYNEDLLAKVAKLRQDAREEKAKGKDPSLSESKQIAAVRKGDALTKEANRMAQEEKFVHLTPEEIQSGMTQFELIPELNEAVKIWNKQRENAVKVLVDSGLWTEAEADFLLSNADYVPFYREEQLEEGKGPKEFLRSLMVQAKEKKLRGSKKPVNDIFDNMVRWTQYSINRAVRNRSAVALADTAVEVGLAREVENKKDGDNVVTVWKDGKQRFYSMEDPLFMEAFTGLESVSIPTIRWASKMADILRQSVVLYPAFAVSQLPQDSFAAMFTSGLKPQYALTIPLRAVKEFVQTLRGKSKAHEELKNFGVVGVRDFSSAMVRLDTEIYAGLKAPPGVAGKLKRVLGNIAMASDNAVRQATYEAAVAQGLSRAEALEKAFEIFNVRRKGSSRMLALAGQVIPFFSAYLAAQNVAYKTITGTGTSPTEREAAYKSLLGTTASVMALSLIYAMMNADDDDYLNKPTPTRDRLLMIPGTGGMSIPLRADLYTVPKVLTEHLYLLLTDNGYEDAAKFRSSMASVLTSAILSPTPVPQVIKPLVEVAINYDFYQQKPLIGQFQKEKDVSRQFEDSTSELAKLFGKTELIPPIAVDHLVRGMLGTTGGLVLYTTNFFLQADSDVPRPQMSMRDAVATIPGVSGFVSKEYESALRKDFYELAEVTQRAAATLSDLKNRSPELIEDYVSDEKVAARLELSKAVNQIARDLTNIRRNITQVTNASEEDMTAAEKQEAIRDLREAERDLLKSVGLKEMREMAGL